MTDKETSPLERRNDETPLQYHKRIIRGKLCDRTLADFDYSELSKYAYGKEYAGDVARRMFYGSNKTLDLLDAELVAGSEKSVQRDIEAQIVELQKERQRFFDQRREYKKLLQSDSRLEHLFDALTVSANNLTNTVGNVFPHEYAAEHVFGHSPEQGEDYCEAVLVLSDWHYGLKTNNIFNRYDMNICKERLRNVVSKVKQKIIKNNCGKVHIVVLGDLIHGGIHVSARVASEELVCDQLMQVSELLAQSIFEIAKCVSEVDVHMTYGNHARTIQNKNDSIHRDNLERIIPWWLETRLLAEERRIGNIININVVPDDGNEFLLFESCGHEFCASHGDLDTIKESPRLLTTLFQKRRGRNIEYILLGDKHHREGYNELGVDALLCGSLCGTDDYANEKRLYSTPSQLLLIVNEKEGVDDECRIKCD